MDREDEKIGRFSTGPEQRRMVLVLTDPLTDAHLLDELRGDLPGEGTKVLLVSPAVERSPLHHALGDADTAKREAQQRLDSSLKALRGRGIAALGEVGDSDPVAAAASTLRQYPADEVLIVVHADDQARWFEDGLLERAREILHPPVRMIVLREEEDASVHVAGVREVDPGMRAHGSADGRGSRRLAAILLAIAGAIAAIVLVVLLLVFS